MNGDARNEKRQYPRHELYSAVLLVQDQEGHLSEVLDLSAGGARVGRPESWVSGSSAPIRMFFIFDQETVIGIDAVVVRDHSEHLGMQFLDDQHETVERILYESRFSDNLIDL